MKRVTKPGGVVASGVHQFFGGMPAFDLVQHTGAVLDAAINEMRTFFKGRPLFWPNGQAGLWRKLGLVDAQRASLRFVLTERADRLRPPVKPVVRWDSADSRDKMSALSIGGIPSAFCQPWP